ncbi:TVP38/TMEM64 family protein [Thalassobacillus hwangdonensis]|uniref:TVP38/TMEM64 family membrane protein n=1 Tax=Thalassobacillus hwangdonensis TaxID=546108 RepID=A0ABW3L1Q8_9BACI
MKLKVILRSLLFLTVFIGIAWYARSQFDVSAEQIRSYILSFGIWGPLVFMFLYTIGPIVVFPTSILSLGAAYAYGIWPGMPYIIVGATGAAITGYVMGRFFGDSVVKFGEFKWSETIYERMKERGFFYVLILRLIPVIGFDILSYSAGVTRVNFRAFIPATVIGMIPGTFVYSFLGSSLATGNRTMIMSAIGLFIAMLLVTFIFRKQVKKLLGLDEKGEDRSDK